MLFYVSQDQVGERAIFCPKMLSEYFSMQEKCKEKNVRDVQNLKFAKMLKKIK
jgi:hypothetical protein